MESTSVGPPIPSPSTPAAIPLTTVDASIVPEYVVVSSTAVFIWDVVNNLGEDYLLLFKYKVRAPTIAYFVSRLASLGFGLAATIFGATPISRCATVETIANWMYPFAVSSTTLLFFFRVRAVYGKKTTVVAFFGFMWLAVLAGVVTVIPGIAGANMGSPTHCGISYVHPYIAAGIIIPFINDTLVFSAITWKLMGHARSNDLLRTGLRTLTLGNYLPALSKALLQDGQKYYLATVTTTLITVIMLFLNAVDPDDQIMFTITNLAVMNIMACRVFRKTKIGLCKELESASSGVMRDMPKDCQCIKLNKPRGAPSTSLSLASMKFGTASGLSNALERVEEQSAETKGISDYGDAGSVGGEKTHSLPHNDINNVV